jgi:hypothetical protein
VFYLPQKPYNGQPTRQTRALAASALLTSFRAQ